MKELILSILPLETKEPKKYDLATDVPFIMEKQDRD
jgi:hypothetical protein